RRVPDERDAKAPRGFDHPSIGGKRQARRGAKKFMKLDQVVAELHLLDNVALNLLWCVEPRLVDEGTRCVDRWSEQRAGFNLFAPFQERWTAAQIHYRRYPVGQIERAITKIISRRNQRTPRHMDVSVD